MNQSGIDYEARFCESLIKKARQKLRILMSVKPGYLYKFETVTGYPLTTFVYLGRFLDISDANFNFECFASNIDPYQHRTTSKSSYVSRFKYQDIYNLTGVDVNDLPLHLGMAWKSSRFLEIIAGKSRLRIPKGVINCL